ncbi:MAG: endonuclease MutS2, partial [Planctomycetota bacterium]
DDHLVMASPQLQVITGPNTGGKTVVLKVAGLSALMAYTGIPIPAAASSRIPVFDRILADIGDEQSLEQNLSTFSAHMTVTADILRLASSRSLVLLDELGAGTDPLEGAALAEAILERLYKRGAFTLVSTHLGSLKEFAFQHRKCENACMEFDPEKASPTYRLLSGLPGRSSALVIARRIGVPTDVVDRAEEIGGASDASEAVIEGMERAKRQLEQKRNEMEKQRKQAHQLREDAAQELQTMQTLRQAIDHEAERAEESRVHAAIAAIEAALKELGEPPRERRPAYDRLRETLATARRQTTLAERRHATAQALRKGEAVFVPKLGTVSEVKKINKGKQLITVEVNGIPMEVPFGEISWILPPPGYQREWYE